MPTLLLARHARAEAPRHGLSDHARELTDEGREHATRLGQRLAEAGLVPDLVLVSSATRTVQTWELISQSMPGVEARIEDDLYESAPGRYLAVVGTAGDATTVLVVGHEPTTSTVATTLAGPGSSTDALKRAARGMPTSAAAVLEGECSWADLGPRCARMTDLIKGKS